jgi:hypothetical protein
MSQVVAYLAASRERIGSQSKEKKNLKGKTYLEDEERDGLDQLSQCLDWL